MNYGNNFGLIAIDWSPKDPLISLQIRDEAGDITIQQKVALSVLQPGTLKTRAAEGPVTLNGETITPELIKTLLNKEVTLEMVVRATGATKKGDLVFLNSESERGPDNFTVVLDPKAQDSLKAVGVTMPRKHFLSKQIRVTGTLTVFRDQPQIIVSDAKQIRENPAP